MIFSDLGERFAGYSGITHLMDDLNEGLLQDDVIMMGGESSRNSRGVGYF